MDDSFDSTDSSNDTDEPGEKDLYLQPSQAQVYNAINHDLFPLSVTILLRSAAMLSGRRVDWRRGASSEQDS
jgi:hypothetical protein